MAALLPPSAHVRPPFQQSSIAPRIVNLAQWRRHLLQRLRQQIQQIQQTGDAVPMPLRFRIAQGVLRFTAAVLRRLHG